MADFSGSFPHDLLDLNDWRWQGPVKANGSLGQEGDGDAVSVPGDEADTSKMETYRDDPWFVLVTDDGAPYVRFRSPAKGSTTSTSKTTRSELREMHHPDDDRAAKWDATGSEVHNLKVRLAITKVMEKNGKASRVAVAQVHKTSKFGIIVFLDGESGELRWKQESPADDGSLGRYRLGDYVDIGLSVRDGKCKIFVNDVQKAEGKLVGDAAKTCYFKTGCYNQDNKRDDGYPADAINEVRIAAVRVQHGTAWAPGGYEPIGPGVRRSQPRGRQEPRDGEQRTGSKPRDLIQFNGPKQAWKLNLDVDDNGKHRNSDPEHAGIRGGSVEKSARSLADGFVHDGHFEVAENGTAVRFLSHLGGTTTGGSSNPRTELREMKPGSPEDEESWSTSGSRIRRLTAEVKVVRAPRTPGRNRVSIGQIHDGDDLVQIMYDGKKKAVGYTWDDGNGNGRWQDDLLLENYEPGERWFTYRIEAGGGKVRISIDGQQKVVRTVSRTGCYFKVGAYTQSHVGQPGADPNDCGEALFRSIVVETVDSDDD